MPKSLPAKAGLHYGSPATKNCHERKETNRFKSFTYEDQQSGIRSSSTSSGLKTP